MLDIRLVREEVDRLKERIGSRGTKIDWDELLAVDRERRDALANLERLKERKNRLSGEIGKLKKSSGDAAALMREAEEVSGAIRKGEKPLAEIEARFQKPMLSLPNLPHPTGPVGSGP